MEHNIQHSGQGGICTYSQVHKYFGQWHSLHHFDISRCIAENLNSLTLCIPSVLPSSSPIEHRAAGSRRERDKSSRSHPEKFRATQEQTPGIGSLWYRTQGPNTHPLIQTFYHIHVFCIWFDQCCKSCLSIRLWTLFYLGLKCIYGLKSVLYFVLRVSGYLKGTQWRSLLL